MNRTDTITWVNIRTPEQFRGVKVKEVQNGYEILWDEEIDNRNNTLTVSDTRNSSFILFYYFKLNF